MKNFSQITENLDVANKKYIDDGLSKKVNTSDIVQVTGADITKIMSQKAVTDLFANYVTTNTEQEITGKKTVVTPPATDDSTQIANTAWVRTNYQEKGYAGIDGAVLNADGKVTDKDGNVVDALYFKVASLTTEKAYMRTYLLAEVAMTNVIKEQATVLIRCTTESSTSAPNITITFDNYSYASLLLPKNIFVTADYKSGTAGATFTVWVKQDKDFMQQVWNVLSQNTRNYTTTSKREWSVFYSNITKATAVTDINAAPTGYTRIVANNNNRYSNLEENTYLWQQSQNAGITWKKYSDNTTRGVFRHYDDGTTENFVTQSDGFLFRPLNNNNTKSIKVDPKTGVLYPEQNSGADLGKTTQRWNAVYAGNTGVRSTGNIICDSKVISYSAVESNKEVPDFNGILKDDLYTTAPTKTRGAQYLARDKNGAYIGGLRIYHNTNGTIQSQLLCRSQNTDVQNYVYFQARPDATSNAEKDKFAFIPRTNGNIDLGLSNNKWNNGYITNIQGCKVINGGGDNLTINGTATVATPPNKDNSKRIATTAWAGRRYKSIADFGFTSQTTVKAIVQKIIDNLYEYCTFACTNDNFNNFSDTPDGYGTLIIEVGSNALRPLISFTKQIGDSNSYKHWQANIVRGANNQVSEIQWYEIINSNLPQTIGGTKTFEQNIVRKSNDIDISVASTTNVQYSFIDFNDKNGERIAAIGSRHDKDKYSGAYLQAKNVASMGIVVDDKNNVKTFAPTPSDGDNSTKIATTGWVLRNYNNTDICYRGVDSDVKYAGYYKVAEATLPNWYRVSSARILVQDYDSADNGVLNVNVYAGAKKVNNVATATTIAQVGFLEGTNCNGIKGRFFLVVRKQSTTERKPIKVELWYRQTGEYQRISATFLTDIGDSRGGLTASNKWVKITRTVAQEQSYFDKNVVDLTNGFVPNGKFTTTDIALGGYPITEIYDDSTNNAQFVAGALRIANSEHTRRDTPETASKREIIFTDKNNASIATIQSSIGSTWNGLNLVLTNKGGGSNSIEFVYDTTKSFWRFNPTSASVPIDLGEPNRPWDNIYGSTVHTSKILSSEDSKEYVACKSSGVEIGYNDRPLRLYANSRPVTAGSSIMVASDFVLSGTTLTINLP